MRFIVLAGFTALLLLGALPISAEEITGPSFDCKKASSNTEHTICASSLLSKLDREMSETYSAANGELSSGSAEEATLLVEQRLWNKERGKKCGDHLACLSSMYRERILALREEISKREARKLAEVKAEPRNIAPYIAIGSDAESDLELGVSAVSQGKYITALEVLNGLSWANGVSNSIIARAQFLLGEMFDKGLGVVADSVEAQKWWTRAELNGHAKIAENIGNFDNECRGFYKRTYREFTRVIHIDNRTAIYTWGTTDPSDSVTIPHGSTVGDDECGRAALMILNQERAIMLDFDDRTSNGDVHRNYIMFEDLRKIDDGQVSKFPFFQIKATQKGNCFPNCGDIYLLVDPNTLDVRLKFADIISILDLGDFYGFCLGGQQLFINGGYRAADQYLYKHTYVEKSSLNIAKEVLTPKYGCDFDGKDYSVTELEKIRQNYIAKELEAGRKPFGEQPDLLVDDSAQVTEDLLFKRWERISNKVRSVE
jgi:uncharacterized protein